MKNCVFCQIVQGKIKSWKIYENDYVFAFLDINPLSQYHTLVIPKKHYKDIFDIPEKELNNIMTAIKKITTFYKKELDIDNVQILNNSGKEAQQDVFHIHFHIIPRHSNDQQDIPFKPQAEFKKKLEESHARINTRANLISS